MRGKITALFSRYLKEGGVFEYYQFGQEFLRSLFSSIITKDIVGRYEVKHPSVIKELALLMVNYFTSKISLNNLTKNLKIKSSHTTKEYLKYIENTFLVFTINKFSYKLKEQLATFKKGYIMDNGIISSLISDLSENRGRLLENLVAIELKRKSWREGFGLYYWDNYNVECDFIKKEGREITGAYQVCLELNLNNREREISGLIAALKEFGLKEGLMLTESTEQELKVGGFKIKIMPVWKWLLLEKA
jgi:predicted AAA+ superfamily ATPase